MTSKSAEQVRSIVKKVLKYRPIICSEKLRVHTITSDYETSVVLAVQLLTNYVGSVRCVAISLALCVNEDFLPDAHWQMYMELVEKVTKHFNYHVKDYVLLREKQLAAEIT